LGGLLTDNEKLNWELPIDIFDESSSYSVESMVGDSVGERVGDRVGDDVGDDVGLSVVLSSRSERTASDGEKLAFSV